MGNVNIWTNDYNPFNKWKVLAWYDRMLAIKEGKFKAPINVALDIIQGTQKKKMCGGFSCNFCMSNYEEVGKVSRIPKDLLLDIPQFYNKWGVKSICLAGHNSDPLSYKHKDLILFLQLCKKHNVEVGFVSNGYLFTNELIEAVAETCAWSGWSINAGTSKTHSIITNTPEGTFEKIIENIKKMSEVVKRKNFLHAIGYKYLITDENYNEIVNGVKTAKDIGVNHFQIRPCDLPRDRSEKIDVAVVEKQIKKSLEYEKEGFEIFGIREKFTPNFSKKSPKRCIASPLGSTWMADGDIVICPDRRWSAHLPNMVLGNFIEEGLDKIREKWGGEQHLKMIKEANNHLGECMRCTSFSWNEVYENCIEKDSMNMSLI